MTFDPKAQMVREMHKEALVEPGICVRCREPWPCSARRSIEPDWVDPQEIADEEAEAVLDAILGDVDECGREWSSPNRAVWPPVIMHHCDLPADHDSDQHHCSCSWCEVA